MTWTKLSDDFSDECWTLSDAAFRLLVEMLNYSNRKLLDCRIPKDELRRFAKQPDAVAELVSATYVHDEGDSYRVAFHSLYQPTREQMLKIRDRNQKNGRKGGRPRNNPSGNPDGNPEGRDGTGRANTTKPDVLENETENVNPATGEIVDSPVEVQREGNKVRLVGVA
ncbi:hypothetical protein [Paramicrobacterium chengjingii]|uniref:Uncharacterized protein n=1 Tax=Paramicrobacterium chengjingii TaxID=2769067 RepID=A0ABX6YMJ7_9MICO|nr:hypothetical protein [Microbacterium chengjingii]QPZ39527.1 hypothetical protein HCR76_05580 [Microbacterium chengjingii]